MASIDTSSFFTTIPDPIYSVTARSVGIDASTSKTNRRVIAPASSGNNQYSFNYRTQGSSIRFDATALEISLRMSAAAGTEALLCAPAWNLIGNLIQNLKLSFNDSAVEIYNQSSSYLADFTSRLLKNFTIDQLEKMDEFLFTPIIDEEYIYAHANATKYAPGAFLDVAGTSYVTANSATGPDDAEIVAAAPTAPRPLTGEQSSMLARYNKYILNTPFVNQVNNVRTYTVRIPFSHLFGIYTPIILRNLSSIQMTIDFKASVPLDKVNAAGDGICRVLSCSVITEDYIKTPGTVIETVDDKLKLESDNLCFLKASVQQMNWNSANMLLSAKKNVESVVLLQFANEQNIDTANAATMGGSCGQLCLFNNQGTAVANFKRKCLGVPSTANGQVPVPASIQISYGADITYPDAPIILRGAADAFDPVPIYDEYLKALNKNAGDRVVGNPISVYDFASTMPFIMLKMSSPHAVKLHEPADLNIKMTGSGPTIAINRNVWCVVFEYCNVRILSSGSVALQN